jgi:hypothetical protein
MEYIATPDGQIQADFARRIGQVLLHYEAGTAFGQPQDSYEATLTICLLQALLTNCVELIDKKVKNDRTGLKKIASRSLEEDPALFGLNLQCITRQWPSDRPLKGATGVKSFNITSRLCSMLIFPHQSTHCRVVNTEMCRNCRHGELARQIRARHRLVAIKTLLEIRQRLRQSTPLCAWYFV